ncbi:polynucleotide adenylyltransferase PcnB [Thalassolituus oleivorans]|uniref:polynucleotide adenylyltransferase PcnB n=1 Tax=Thalassolituus oleivorans TaxID=187493 RepID=UPI001CB8D9F8|nr:polynucleotide adenylyltransferase PcnB [Thalassolituus oleivorans]
MIQRHLSQVTLINRVKRLFGTKKRDDETLKVVPRDEHSISRSSISEAALKVLYRLNKAGYEAYLVGGGVRDTLLGLSPKDFDVATNATPEQVNQLFRNSRLIGRRFKLVHVVFGREVIEVATFRAPPTEEHPNKLAATGDQGMILRDNVYGNKDEDAVRRDFTINALYYNVADFSVHSYAGGWEDLQERRIRLIGDPETRYREDPVRMLRAIRFAAKLNFNIDPEAAAPIPAMAPLLTQIPAARLFEEVLKLILHGNALDTLRLLREYKLFEPLFPGTEQSIKADPQVLALIENTMANTDKRIQAGKSVTPYFFLAALLWPQVARMQREFQDSGLAPHPAMQKAADRALAQQLKATSIPKRFSIPMREIWELQLRLPKVNSRRTSELLTHPRFRAAYDFVLLREQSGEDLGGIGEYWTKRQEVEPAVPRADTNDYSSRPDGKKRRRRGPRKPRSSAE